MAIHHQTYKTLLLWTSYQDPPSKRDFVSHGRRNKFKLVVAATSSSWLMISMYIAMLFVRTCVTLDESESVCTNANVMRYKIQTHAHTHKQANGHTPVLCWIPIPDSLLLIPWTPLRTNRSTVEILMRYPQRLLMLGRNLLCSWFLRRGKPGRSETGGVPWSHGLPRLQKKRTVWWWLMTVRDGETSNELWCWTSGWLGTNIFHGQSFYRMVVV